jgi:hypothetical protein
MPSSPCRRAEQACAALKGRMRVEQLPVTVETLRPDARCTRSCRPGPIVATSSAAIADWIVERVQQRDGRRRAATRTRTLNATCCPRGVRRAGARTAGEPAVLQHNDIAAGTCTCTTAIHRDRLEVDPRAGCHCGSPLLPHGRACGTGGKLRELAEAPSRPTPPARELEESARPVRPPRARSRTAWTCPARSRADRDAPPGSSTRARPTRGPNRVVARPESGADAFRSRRLPRTGSPIRCWAWSARHARA